MKKAIIILSILMVSAMGWAQEKSSTAPKTAKTEKKQKPVKAVAATEIVVFDSLTIDYGTIKQGANGERIFKFKNKGKKPVVLTNVRASCGCTTPSYSKEPIKSKKGGEIVVKYNTNSIGSFQKSISVYTNLNPDTPIVLTIKGNVIPAEDTTTTPKQ